tara:strand:+ start:369 stop:644 length:276 start_codon:yes stop_codon:yes gene_type:complete
MFETADLVRGLIVFALVSGYYVQKLINAEKDNLLEMKELRDRVFKLEWQSEQDTGPALKGLQRQIDLLHTLREQLLSITQDINRRLEKLEK